jgi:hypothetical protein
VGEQTEQTETDQLPAEEAGSRPNKHQLAYARRFVAAHGTPSRGVVEHLGRAGARVVLVGADGAMGDVIVASTAAGEALLETVADLEPAVWDAETVNATVIGAGHRRKMANPSNG